MVKNGYDLDALSGNFVACSFAKCAKIAHIVSQSNDVEMPNLSMTKFLDSSFSCPVRRCFRLGSRIIDAISQFAVNGRLYKNSGREILENLRISTMHVVGNNGHRCPGRKTGQRT